MSPSPDANQPAPSISARYRMRKRLGVGSLGTAYLAMDESAGRLVTLKVLHQERLRPEGIEHIQREFRALAELHHPQVAAAYDFGYTSEGHLPYYTREYIKGAPLEGGPPGLAGQSSPRQFLKPILDLLDALKYLHSQGILHLDIHPGNLIVSNDPARGAVLIDFGLFLPLMGSRSPVLRAVPTSAAPELARGGQAGPAADIYSAGRLLLYRLTGNEAGDPKLPREVPGWGQRLTLELERIAAKAIHADPARRFRSAEEFRRALSEAVGGPERAQQSLEPSDLTVGRESELRAIEDAIREALDGRPAAIWFAGPTGIGKSRLLTEARWRAQIRGLEVVEAHFLPRGIGRPSLLEALRPGRQRRGTSLAWLGPLEAAHGGSTLERSARAADAYFAAEGPPLALLLDDVEHAERESRLLLEALLGEAARRRVGGIPGRGLCLFLSSLAPPSRWLQEALGKGNLKLLKPLRAAESRAFLSTLLQPLSAEAAFLARVSREAGGIPAQLRRAACALHAEWTKAKAIPGHAKLPPGVFAKKGAILEIGDEKDLVVLQAVAVLERPASALELAAATGLDPASMARAAARLLQSEALRAEGRGRSRVYYPGSPEIAEEARRRLTPSETRRIHGRMIEFLRREHRGEARDAESLARHLLAVGRRAEGRAAVLRAAELLREEGDLAGSASLLRHASDGERGGEWRLRFAEEASAVFEMLGDHEEGIAILEPIWRGDTGRLRDKDAVRVRRRLGVHYHRAGAAASGLEMFREALREAAPERDREELIFIHSELAEIHTIQGRYAEAEEACRRGLDLLEKVREEAREGRRGIETGFEEQMDVTLHASLGNLKLRTMALEEARIELERSYERAGTRMTTVLKALVLNNLGVVHNQRNDFDLARSCHRRAEELHDVSGERRGRIQIACNLAHIEAKTGNAAAAREHQERAEQLLRDYPGGRLQFLVTLSRGMVEGSLGHMARAAKSLEDALPLGRELGDLQFVRFGEVYLAEACILCGRYAEALTVLRSSARTAAEEGPLVLRRMALSRLVLGEALVGRARAADSLRRTLAGTPRTTVGLLEAWNDLALGQAMLLGREPATKVLTAAEAVFKRIGIPAGARLARSELLKEAIENGEVRSVRRLLDRASARDSEPTEHGLLSILEPCVHAEGWLLIGDLEHAKECLEAASGALVGQRFLELDWRVDFLRARLAERQGDREAARHHLERSLHTCDLLAAAAPAKQRRAFLAQARFAPLKALATRVEKPRPTPTATRSAGEPPSFHGLVGRSKAMLRVFEEIEELRDHDCPVLVVGETGTGKELAARAIHTTSSRRGGPFHGLHCASLPPELFETELFGYEAGAFTGAEEPHAGLLAHVAGGTLLLDGVTLLAPVTQAKLLRVIDAKAARPVGGVSPRPIDVRIFASATPDIEEAVGRQEFRADLYYRLRAAEVRLPPLRERREDIALLARHFLRSHARRLDRPAPQLSPEALKLLEEESWMGNVRELESVLLRASMAASGTVLLPETIRGLLPERRAAPLFPESLIAGKSLEILRREIDKAYLTHLFREKAGDLKGMTEVLGMKKASLYAWLKRVGIDVRALRRKE